jgi:hypothetical protein
MGGVFILSCFLRWDGRSVYCELRGKGGVRISESF